MTIVSGGGLTSLAIHFSMPRAEIPEPCRKTRTVEDPADQESPTPLEDSADHCKGMTIRLFPQ